MTQLLFWPRGKAEGQQCCAQVTKALCLGQVCLDKELYFWGSSLSQMFPQLPVSINISRLSLAPHQACLGRSELVLLGSLCLRQT